MGLDVHKKAFKSVICPLKCLWHSYLKEAFLFVVSFQNSYICYKPELHLKSLLEIIPQNISLHSSIVQEITVVFGKLLQTGTEFSRNVCICVYIDSSLKNRKFDFSKSSLVEVKLEYNKGMATS
jgi:hypothetical protein